MPHSWFPGLVGLPEVTGASTAKIGLDYDFYENKIKRVLELRNSYDVAHHDLTSRGADVIEQNYGEAVETTSTILASHSEHSKNKDQQLNTR